MVPEPEAAEPTCEARLSDAPSIVLREQYLVRPPYGVELLDDGNPMFTSSAGSFESSCGVPLKRMMLMAFAYDPQRPLHLMVNDLLATLEQQGYQGGMAQHTSFDSARRHAVSMLYPATDSMPATELLLDFQVFGDQAVVVIFETAEGDLAALHPSLEASASSLLRIPPEAD